MVFSSQGPVFKTKTVAGKIFISLYGSLSAVFLIGIIWLIVEPTCYSIIHAILKKKIDQEESLIRDEEETHSLLSPCHSTQQDKTNYMSVSWFPLRWKTNNKKRRSESEEIILDLESPQKQQKDYLLMV